MADNREQLDPELPEPLKMELQRMYRVPVVPGEVDEAILETAGRHLANRRRFRMALRWAGAAAAAAVVLIAVLIVPHRSSPQLALVPSAHVTILDAFQLGRMLRDHQYAGPGWDVNHDGSVDQKDVQVLTTDAVRLKEGVDQ